MSERDTYEPGVPSWVDTLQPDPQAAMSFYGSLFGWDFEGSDDYFVARLRGRDVAGLGPTPPGTPPGWNTYVTVASADDAAAKAQSAGGAVLVEPRDVDPAGRFAILADPTGASFGVWEPRDRQGAQLVNEPGAWAMSELLTPDPEAASSFYGELFGWTTEAFGPITMFRLPGYVGGEPQQPVSREVVAAMAPAEPGAQPHWQPGFWIDDADAAASKIAELGGSVLSPPTDQPPGRGTVLADPNGVAFSVSSIGPKR
jgi:predicted enzyme related to lactoylglutathione lyase